MRPGVVIERAPFLSSRLSARHHGSLPGAVGATRRRGAQSTRATRARSADVLYNGLIERGDAQRRGPRLKLRLRPGDRAQPGYGAAVRLLWETSRPLSVAVAIYTAAASVLPNVVLVAAGRLVGDVPAAARDGLSSPAGDRLIGALAITGVAYAAALLLGPMQSALASVVKWRLVYNTQDRLIAAVSRPVGTGHLEDPAVLDDLSLAQGQLVNQWTADAPMTLALVVSNRASGLIACGVLASWRWWLGLGMLAMWIVVRRPQLKLIREQGALYAGSSEVLRRAWYLQRLAAMPQVAKESRVFGLGGWLVDRYKAQALRGFGAPWAALRRLDRTVLTLSVVVLAAYGAACGYLGYAAYHGEIALGTLAVMLPMLVATMSFGDISWDDVALAWMLQGVPRASRLEASLAPPESALRGTLPTSGLPAREVRFEHVRFRYPLGERSVFEDLNPYGSGAVTLAPRRRRCTPTASGQYGPRRAASPSRRLRRRMGLLLDAFRGHGGLVTAPQQDR